MIGYLTGEPMFFSDYVIIKTAGGVGYKVFVNQKTLAQNQIKTLDLFTYSYLKEDRSELYGFATSGELQLFVFL
ncbi:MAG: OB-fold domain-containing protein, partial [bacterium]|nr:OB-fold domain-containing protein [bacterium]